MSQNTRKIAVLTGDLVNSTGLGPEKVERAFDALEACAEMQAEWMDGQSLHFTRHRGDGWQVALMEPKYALRSALCFRASLRALGEEFDSYIGIAEGKVEGEIGPDLNAETEKVFVHSGTALEEARDERTLSKMGYSEKGWNEATALLLEEIFSRWTPTQAAAAVRFLAPHFFMTITEVANDLGRHRQAVGKTLKAAGVAYIREALANCEFAMSKYNA